jgi:XRE family aerobic/anaerobic benzoate catabolism transcriptional regulator
MQEAAFLRELGRRIRQARLERGLSLAALALRAEVSRRYLTDLEAGRANPSLLLLAGLSAALARPLTEWVDIPLRSRSAERIALLGLRGAGKSTVGRRLALVLEVPFIELDQEVERLAGLSLGALFELHGAAGFQRLAREALEKVLASAERLVLAVGGSAVEDPELFERLRTTCRTVCLLAEPAEHFERVLRQGDLRPMQDRPRAFAELEDLLERRRALFARCDLVLSTSKRSPESVAESLLGWLASESGRR